MALGGCNSAEWDLQVESWGPHKLTAWQVCGPCSQLANMASSPSWEQEKFLRIYIVNGVTDTEDPADQDPKPSVPTGSIIPPGGRGEAVTSYSAAAAFEAGGPSHWAVLSSCGREEASDTSQEAIAPVGMKGCTSFPVSSMWFAL